MKFRSSRFQTAAPARSFSFAANRWTCALGLAVGLGLTGCKGKTIAEPAPGGSSPAASPVASSAAPKAPPPAAANPAPAAGVVWTDPPGWKRVAPTSSMRKATYLIAPAAGDTAGAELAVFYFGAGQGGSVEANIQRWVGQFAGVAATDIQRSERTVGSLKAHLVEIPSGSYTDSMASMHGGSTEPKPNYSLQGAIVETPGGPYFFKLTGPKKTVESAKGDFMNLLESVRAQ
jgi:hypothetical protein